MDASVSHRLRAFALVLCCSFFAAMGLAAGGDSVRGRDTYARHCAACHGSQGDGLGPGSERLLPPPRDFTFGMFKMMSTAFDGYMPQDQDIYEAIRDGMPGTAMPGWGDILSRQEMWDLVAYIKTFPGYDQEQPGSAVDVTNPVPPTVESIEKGRQLFLEDDRCSECHGEEGKGDAVKRLLGDLGERTWPRNLTKPWTFRKSNEPTDVFTRISTGIPGTQMPSFADPASTKMLTEEERWHVANFVNSLGDKSHPVDTKNTVIKSMRAEGNIPNDPYAPAWEAASPTTFWLVPQLIAGQRHFTLTNDTITARSMHTSDEIAILLEWDDRTMSSPGNEQAVKLSESPMFEDMVAVQFPMALTDGSEKPYFLMGEEGRPVQLWRWSSGDTCGAGTVSLLKAAGVENVVEEETHGLAATGAYKAGTWRVLFSRPMTAESKEGIQIKEGTFIPIAFSVWDGSAGETGTKHTLTTWYWLLLESDSSTRPVFGALLALLLIVGLEYLWIRSSRRSEGAS